MHLELLIKRKENGGWVGRVARIVGASCVIGRKKGDISLRDPRCSRQHAMLFETKSGELALKQLGTTNGTYVNGEKVETIKILNPGDKVTIGSTIIQINHFRPINGGERNTEVGGKPLQGEEAEVYSGWPNTLAALPEEQRRKFSKYFVFSSPSSIRD